MLYVRQAEETSPGKLVSAFGEHTKTPGKVQKKVFLEENNR